MSDDDTDRRLRSLLDSLSLEHLDRLKILVDARTAVLPAPPVDGPKFFRGVPVPEVLRPNWDQPEANWWRAGATAALDLLRPVVEALRYDSPCSFDHHGYCQEHGHLAEGPCPDVEARRILEETEADG